MFLTFSYGDSGLKVAACLAVCSFSQANIKEGNEVKVVCSLVFRQEFVVWLKLEELIKVLPSNHLPTNQLGLLTIQRKERNPANQPLNRSGLLVSNLYKIS